MNMHEATRNTKCAPNALWCKFMSPRGKPEPF